MGPHPVCPVADLPPGERTIVTVEGIEIGVFNVDGEFHALRNVCPHKRAPLCQGTTMGLRTAETPDDVSVEREGEILKCPWHGWEFDVTDGHLVVDPNGMRARTYDVSIADCDGFEGFDSLDDVEVETFDVSVDDDVLLVHV
ncbi:Rieske (2Fe-2S) protein [Haloarculaceae archaeon H-GB2-1]|nr:Rieske (2Fe-2S) protein [Haloarculaceae archaeon H-GB1-1]MEA5387928.1 Rieske (2Fe-2S) protein [Haloarculaceae archaeon H-GB11]MEA5409422.1 Rieske (2Fe-2S) protein [Haloarculaceae archaeon H-GB2-1]